LLNTNSSVELIWSVGNSCWYVLSQEGCQFS
jgi:hypothetical protein